MYANEAIGFCFWPRLHNGSAVVVVVVVVVVVDRFLLENEMKLVPFNSNFCFFLN